MTKIKLSMQVNKPNFFILGAAKSGSTSLYCYLKQHPDIFLTAIKEPTFFSEGHQVIQNPITYFELYDQVCTEKILGEASHVYLTNPSTAKVLKALFPNAKFVIILRNPADRAYSLYHHMRRVGLEYINTFEKAIEMEEKRYNSQRFLKTCPQYLYNYLYFRSGLYGEQLQRYFSIFSPEQFHVIKFENFIVDPINHLQLIFQFLNIDADFVPNIEIHNEGNMTARIPKVHYFFNAMMTPSTMLWNFFNSAFFQSLLQKFNMIETPPINTATRERLLDKYAEDLKLLYQLTNISFT